MIVPNIRASFARTDASFIVRLLAQGDRDMRRRQERRLRRDGLDALLDDPRTLNALMASGGITTAPAALVYYLLTRHALLEGGIRDRGLADYLATLLRQFGRRDRAHRIDEEDEERFYYLVDIARALESASGRRAFLLRAHLGNFALWSSGIFPARVRAKVERSGAPGLSYYEEMGATGYRLAADSAPAEGRGLERIYRVCADHFIELRVAFNRMADRYLFPAAGDSVDRLLRQVADRFERGSADG